MGFGLVNYFDTKKYIPKSVIPEGSYNIVVDRYEVDNDSRL